MDAVMNIPYWLEATLVIILFVGGFLFVIYKDNGNLKIIPQAFGEFFRRLWDMFFHNIEDRDAYEANKEQREADEKYKAELKKKKKEESNG